MKKNYIFAFLCCLFLANVAIAQVTILDFETAPKSAVFQYFGSTLEPTLTAAIDNPDKTGINKSSKVSNFKKPAGSQSWAGAFSNPVPTTQVDFTTGGKATIKVWSDHVGNLALKFEESTDGSPNWVQKVEIKEINKWIELVFDPSSASLEAPNNKATGRVYKKIVLFFDFDTVLPAEKTWYFDDLIVKSVVGTNDVFSNELITIQPTVASESVTVNFAESFDADTKQINVMSLEGKLVATYSILANSRQQVIPVNNLPNGLYLIQAKAGVVFQTGKIVVNH